MPILIVRLDFDAIFFATFKTSLFNFDFGKQAFYKQLEMPLRKAYSFTSKMMTKNMMTLDAKEGISAFLEKRKPKWKNK